MRGNRRAIRGTDSDSIEEKAPAKYRRKCQGSHLKKKICENTRYTYDLEFFRDRYGKYMEKDDLYLGYYLHLIQDMLYRRFMYEEHGWNSSAPGNVEKLHRDYEILNEYVSDE